MKKLCAIFLSLLLFTASFSFPASAVSFSDVPANSDLSTAISHLVDAGVINGKPGGIFDPNGSLTRAEFVKVSNLLFHLSDSKHATAFADVSAQHWAYQQILVARQAGYINGYGDNRFGPEDKLTREQFCVMIGRINHFENLLHLTFSIKDSVSPWAKDGVNTALACGLFKLNADGLFRAQENITRGEMALALAQYAPKDSTPTPGGDTSNNPGGSTPTTPTTPDTKPEKPTKPTESTPENVVTALKNASSGLSTISYSGPKMTSIITTLKSCIDTALSESNAGTVITKEYVKTRFATEIETVKSTYSVLTEVNQKLIINDIANSVNLTTLNLLQDYFLS